MNKQALNRYENLKEAEIWLEKHMAKYLKNVVNPKDKEEVRFWSKKAEEELYGRKGLKKMPKRVRNVLMSTGETNLRTAGSSFFLSAANLLPTTLGNLDKWSKRDANKRALSMGLKPRYKDIGRNNPLRIKVSQQSPLVKGGTDITALLAAIREERYLTEDILGTKYARDIDQKVLAGLNLAQFTLDEGATNLYYDKRFDNVVHADRKKKERGLYSKLSKDNLGKENIFYLTGPNYRSHFDKESPNYYNPKGELDTQKAPVTAGTGSGYSAGGGLPATWTGRGSGRKLKDVNAETRDWLKIQGLGDREIAQIDDSQLSRLRISGPTMNNARALTIGTRQYRKFGNNTTTGQTVYEGTAAE